MRQLKTEEITLRFLYYPGVRVLRIAQDHFYKSMGYQPGIAKQTDVGCICGPLKRTDYQVGEEILLQ